jgi:sugar/nucleoside kinase (ribokinase family)
MVDQGRAASPPVGEGEGSGVVAGDGPAGHDVVAIGSAIVDVLVEGVTDEELVRLGLEKGTMTLVDGARSAQLASEVRPTARASGGSAANTAVGVAALGGTAGFVGATAADELGSLFRADLQRAGVTVGRAGVTDPSGGDRERTGCCLVLVTSDGQRTMATHLGAAATFGMGDLDEELIGTARLLYLEGYLWDAPRAPVALARAIEVAHDAGAAVALSVSDPLCVKRHRRTFLDLVDDGVDVVFANEDEAMALFAVGDIDRAVRAADDTGVLVAITRGAAGSTVATGAGVVTVPAPSVDVADTTGAGDLYAAGFCYGLTHGADPEACARLGTACAAEVITHLGARPRGDLRSLVRGG